jgi:hypothetical protein
MPPDPTNEPDATPSPAASPSPSPSASPSPTPAPASTTAAPGRHDGTRYVLYGNNTMHAGGSRAWRNNNPGNIKDTDFAREHGAIGRDADGFAIFPDEDTGTQALVDLLNTDTYQGLTLGEAFERYAPPSENETENYIENIENWTGLDADTPMSDLTEEQLEDVANGIRRHEGWNDGDTWTPESDNAPDWVKNEYAAMSPPGEHAPPPTVAPNPTEGGTGAGTPR